MAGAGYKLFNTGDVLTAAQVNTYLQEQAVMVFASAAARTTALSGVLAEGMITYLKDTDAVEKYDGSSWVSIGGSSVPTSYGFTAGKNIVLNGDFRIWQRGTSFSSVADNSYTADRFKINFNGTGVRTVSQQTFTPGTAPVAGYEGRFFCRINQTTAGTGGSYQIFQQPVEDVRNFAGQTVTLSFWAKADSSRTITAQVNQYFGTGGSPSATVTNDSGNLSLTTSWQRFSYTVALASISGKTIGTDNNSYLQVQWTLPYNTTFTIDFWGVQLEANSTATTFQTATGTIQGELAACQRYYFRRTATTAYAPMGANGFIDTTTTAYVTVQHPVSMRVRPTTVEFGSLTMQDSASALDAITNLAADQGTTDNTSLTVTSTNMTADVFGQIIANNSTSAYLALSAEL
jgi:hypothetical protein